MNNFTESEERLALRKAVADLGRKYGRDYFERAAKEGRKTTLWVQWYTNVPRISPTILILLSGGSRLASFTSRAFNGPEVDVTKQDLTLGTTPTQALILRPRRSSGVNGVRISGERQSPRRGGRGRGH